MCTPYSRVRKRIKRPPTRQGAVLFYLKCVVLRALRSIENARRGPKLHPVATRDARFTCELIHRSPLWTSEDAAEFRLQAGKIQNLRVAARALDGVRIPSGETFSFWRQVGKATRRRGYVDGRELREGCIQAGVGGGLCQLSNALYDLALRAGFEIVERHPHTMRVPGSAADGDRDATVAWNHIDLRFRAAVDYQIRIEITTAELVVSLGFEKPIESREKRSSTLRVGNVAARSCETCGEHGCFAHNTSKAVVSRTGRRRTAFLLDARTPEFERELESTFSNDDIVFLPLDGRRWRAPRYAWKVSGDVQYATACGLIRTLNARRRMSPPALRAQQINDADRIARDMARRLPPEAIDVVVDIAYLKQLSRLGVLEGRRVTVWMSRFPLSIVHLLLDDAAARLHGAALLTDFRARAEDVADEWRAIERAFEIVTPHPWLISQLPGRVRRIDWSPVAGIAEAAEPFIFFPGPTAAREGAYAVRYAARNLGVPVSVGGRNLEGPDFWSDVEVLSPQTHPMSRAAAVVCPAVFHNRPIAGLMARSMGKPVVATPTCGIPGAIEVPFADTDVLTLALASILDEASASVSG